MGLRPCWACVHRVVDCSILRRRVRWLDSGALSVSGPGGSMLKRTWMAAAALALVAAFVPAVAASAGPKAPPGPLTLAVYGDSPYGNTPYRTDSPPDSHWQQDKTPAFIDTIN